MTLVNRHSDSTCSEGDLLVRGEKLAHILQTRCNHIREDKKSTCSENGEQIDLCQTRRVNVRRVNG